MTSLRPKIEFRHVLGELSVNRNDPCEVIRELISNSYDAEASNMIYAPIGEEKGFAFFDDGTGLSSTEEINEITPYEAFFSIGKSTKLKGEAIGYKCQGSKLCFACQRIIVITKCLSEKNWRSIIIENPRDKLTIDYDIAPKTEESPWITLSDFFTSKTFETKNILNKFSEEFFKEKFHKGTFIAITGLDTENYHKHFMITEMLEESYINNYIRFYTRHGDIRFLTKDQGFESNQILQLGKGFHKARLEVFDKGNSKEIPYGYPYLEIPENTADIKSPDQIARLRDGRFFARTAKTFNISGKKFSIIFAIDGNRRAHEEYKNLGRKGKAKSGVRLSDQRGVFIAVGGIKICQHLDLLNSPALNDYSILTEKDNSNHFSLIINGDFDLVTNRNSLSRKSFDILSSPEFLSEIKKCLDDFRRKNTVFSGFLSRIKRESTENKLNEQIEILENSKKLIRSRERFRIQTSRKTSEIFLSPLPGEEYLVGVIYSSLYNFLPSNSPYTESWKKVLTFSTQGIDSIGIDDVNASTLLGDSNLISIEYKYSFANSGPFNHALAIVDYIIAWEVELKDGEQINDDYTCFGKVRKINDFWEIYEIESNDGGQYPDRTVKVICLRDLIKNTFNVNYSKP